VAEGCTTALSIRRRATNSRTQLRDDNTARFQTLVLLVGVDAAVQAATQLVKSQGASDSNRPDFALQGVLNLRLALASDRGAGPAADCMNKCKRNDSSACAAAAKIGRRSTGSARGFSVST